MKTSIIHQRSLRPSVDYYSKKLHENMTRLFRNATTAYVMAIVPVIAVDTGMSRSSLVPLGRALRIAGKIRSTIVPQRKIRYGTNDMNGTYNPSGIKSAAEGERAGEDAFKLSYGTYKRPVMSFSFSINVYQYWLHENGYGGGSSWKTLEKGRDAMLEYIRSNSASHIPRITDLIR
jgi:hypothetical protein